jgi:uncharacterized protein YjbI with pentapeptide repeats
MQRGERQGRQWPAVLAWALAAVLSAVAAVFAIWLLPALLTRHPSAGLSTAGRLVAENDVRGPLVGALAVLGAAALTAVYTWRATRSALAGQQIDRDRQQIDRNRQEIDRQAQITDRYTKAIDQLGSDRVDVRIGGIYALERLALDSDRDHPVVMEVLTAFVREHSREQAPAPPTPGQAPSATQEHAVRPDIQAAITVIGRRHVTYDKGKIDLSGAYLAGADFVLRAGVANFSGSNFSNADLTGANLAGANFGNVLLTGANLDGANLTGATLTGANLSRANMSGANLSEANLVNARLISVNLSGAFLGNANLTSATVVAATVSRSFLGAANLANSNLTGTDLAEADLSDANLTGARIGEENRVPAGWMREIGSDRLICAPEEPRYPLQRERL